VNQIFGRVNDLETAGQKEPKEKLQVEVATIANVVRRLAERVDRMEGTFRIDRGHKEPRSPNSLHSSEPGVEATPQGATHRPLAAARQQQQPQHSPSPMALQASPSPVPSRGRSHSSTTLPSVREEDSPKKPQADASAKDASASSVKIPSPRNWLMEPLSVSVARSDGDYPSSLQSSSALHTAPNLGSADLLTRRMPRSGSANLALTRHT